MVKSERGFTLIELLAVITIMGILTLVAVPTVSILIQNTRKKTYIADAKTFKNDVQKEVVNQTWQIDDPEKTYYIHINNVADDREPAPSPWAKWKDAYVVITITDKGDFEYYWLSVDEAGWKVELEVADDLVKGDVFNTNVKRVNYRKALGTTTKIAVLDANGVWKEFVPNLEITRAQADQCYSYEDTSDDTITITWYDETCGSDVIVPAMIGGKTVNAIHQYAFNNKGLNTVFLPDTITSIGSNAFSNNNLTEIYIPESVVTISSQAFANNRLTDLVLEEGLKTMGDRCFKNNQLTVALVPNSVTSFGACSYCDNPIPNPSFLYVQNGDVIDYSKIRGYIGDLTEFTGNNFVIPSQVNGVSLTRIESGAFRSMSLSGWNVTIPDTVTHIADNAFWGSGIASVNLPSNLKYIGDSAFYSNKLTSLNIPNSVTHIGSLAFTRNNISDPDRAFIYKRTASGIDYSTIIGYCGANKNNIVIPSQKNGVTLTKIEGAFRYCNLTGTLTIPDSVTSISNLSFAINYLSDVINGSGDSDGLPIVYKRKSGGGFDKTVIIGYAGYNTSHVTIPSYVKKIGNYGFYYSYIKGVTIPEGVTSIGSQAFALCKLNGTVTIPSTVTSIGNKAFHKEISWAAHNSGLTKIINKTGKSFDWKSITGGPTSATFETGTVRNWYGDIEVTSS